MNAAGLRLERLAPDHDLSDFKSGNLELDSWLLRHGLVAQQMDSARTFLLVLDQRVVGHSALTMGSVRRVEPPTKLVRGLPSYPVGMALLTRLAVERGSQGRGLRRAVAGQGSA